MNKEQVIEKMALHISGRLYARVSFRGLAKEILNIIEQSDYRLIEGKVATKCNLQIHNCSYRTYDQQEKCFLCHKQKVAKVQPAITRQEKEAPEGDEEGIISYVDITNIEHKHELTWADLITKGINTEFISASKAEDFLMDVADAYAKAQQSLIRYEIPEAVKAERERIVKELAELIEYYPFKTWIIRTLKEGK